MRRPPPAINPTEPFDHDFLTELASLAVNDCAVLLVNLIEDDALKRPHGWEIVIKRLGWILSPVAVAAFDQTQKFECASGKAGARGGSRPLTDLVSGDHCRTQCSLLGIKPPLYSLCCAVMAVHFWIDWTTVAIVIGFFARLWRRHCLWATGRLARRRPAAASRRSIVSYVAG